MKDGRSFASLSSGLLARKGQARPAMRPAMASHYDDLGWNDMGVDDDPSVPDADVPAPVVYRRAIEAELAKAAKPAPKANILQAAAYPLKIRSRASSKGKGKVAFTLRLEPEPHLRLRLGCALSGRSAQQIVTQALESFLESIPGLDEMSEQGLTSKKRHS